MSVLKTQDLHLRIGDKMLCRQLQIELHPGEAWGLLGRNGAGKTTLLHSLAGLHPIQQGQILLDGQPLHALHRKQIAKKIGLLLQHTEDSFPISVYQSVLAARYPHLDFWQQESADDFMRVEQALHQVDMLHMRQRMTNQLSGGERQRVAIAALIAQDPNIFLLDEPNSHLDLQHQMQLLEHLACLVRQQHKTLLMSLHDLNLASRFCSHLLLFTGNGEVLAGPREELLRCELLETVYGYPIRSSKQDGQQVFWPA